MDTSVALNCTVHTISYTILNSNENTQVLFKLIEIILFFHHKLSKSIQSYNVAINYIGSHLVVSLPLKINTLSLNPMFKLKRMAESFARKQKICALIGRESFLLSTQITHKK